VDNRILWKKRAPDKNAICLLHAGGNYVLRFGSKTAAEILPIQEALHSLERPSIKLKALAFYGDITENEHQEFEKFQKQHPEWKFIPSEELPSATQIILKLPKKFLRPAHIITPLYLRPPLITPQKT
ncbi:MAG: hypothetical protein AAB588_01310, partial [Patescibacteria group bacterium]